jgi:hypothetical protein
MLTLEISWEAAVENFVTEVSLAGLDFPGGMTLEWQQAVTDAMENGYENVAAEPELVSLFQDWVRLQQTKQDAAVPPTVVFRRLHGNHAAHVIDGQLIVIAEKILW